MLPAGGLEEIVVERRLKRIYWTALAPAAAGFALAAVVRGGPAALLSAAWRALAGVVLFVLAVSAAAALYAVYYYYPSVRKLPYERRLFRGA